MQELTFEQVEDVSGGTGKLWKFIAKNFVTKMGNGTMDDYCSRNDCDLDEDLDAEEEYDEVNDYPGVGLPPK